MPESHISRSLSPTPLGEMLVLCSEKGLRGCWFLGQSHFPKDAFNFNESQTAKSTQIHQAVSHQLALYFSNQIDKFDICLDLDNEGTPFQKEVWHVLTSIPYGATLSYSTIAQKINRPNAVRAVGSAIGRNPISVIIPCHRVIGANGSITGYAGGIERKRSLLFLEGHQNTKHAQ
ncbi:MAG: methylated-DNA--[protein]-cysteine S-methyltransferase [Betaproteobacteria bacterium]|jgi:methylated-DNA-[protein]-cysteine S-methyltransferase